MVERPTEKDAVCFFGLGVITREIACLLKECKDRSKDFSTVPMQINIKNNASKTNDRFKKETLLNDGNPSGRKEEEEELSSSCGRMVNIRKKSCTFFAHSIRGGVTCAAMPSAWSVKCL